MVVNVEVEYCNTCGYGAKFEEMKNIFQNNSNVTVTGFEGRRASFEVKINDTLIHSKLNTMAFPDFQDISSIVTDVEAGKDLRKTCKQQPLTDCCVI